MPDTEIHEQKRGIRFDPTINLGHILTFVGFIFTGFIAWSSLDGRVIIVEQNIKLQALRDTQQDVLLSDQNARVNENLVEIKRAIERLNDKVSASGSK